MLVKEADQAPLSVNYHVLLLVQIGIECGDATTMWQTMLGDN